MDFYDEIYHSLTGELVEGQALPWVPNLFGEDMPCGQAYGRLIAARDRLLERLGQDEDDDLEIMLMEMEEIQYILVRQVLSLRRFSNDPL